MAEGVTEIKSLIESDKLIIGSEEAVKKLKLGQLEKIYLTSNCPDDVKEEVLHYSEISNTLVVEIEIPNDELGIVCKKPFSISVIGLLK